MIKFIKRLWKEQTGQDLIEYALLLVLVALVAGATVRSLGAGVKSTYSTAATREEVENHQLQLQLLRPTPPTPQTIITITT